MADVEKLKYSLTAVSTMPPKKAKKTKERFATKSSQTQDADRTHISDFMPTTELSC